MKNQNIDNRIKELIIQAAKGASPGDLSEIGVKLSGYYALLGEEFQDLIVFQADRWLELRKDAKSDKMADRLWDATEEGKRSNVLRFKLKYLERVMAQINRRLRVAEGESFNRY